MDSVEIQHCLKTFVDYIQKERDNIERVQNEISEGITHAKRSIYLSKIMAAKEICDTIINPRIGFPLRLILVFPTFFHTNTSKFEKEFSVDYLN